MPEKTSTQPPALRMEITIRVVTAARFSYLDLERNKNINVSVIPCRA